MRVYDVWALPTPGGPCDFQLLVRQFLDSSPSANLPPLVRALFAIRWRLGEWLGWDGPDVSVGSRVASLRERLDDELRALPAPDPQEMPFTTVYLTDNEWAAELANKTVHCVLHLSWVPDPGLPGGFRGQMAVLVKPSGWWGRIYMAAIAPFRHFLVYPALMRGIGARWLERTAPRVEVDFGWDGQSLYADTFSLPVASGHPPRWWAQTMFEQLISAARREALFQGVLRLRPHTGHDSVAGWGVAQDSADRLLLARGGRLMDCEMVLETGPDDVRFGLSVMPRNTFGAALWRLFAPLHRRFGEGLLRRTWQRERLGQGGAA